MSDTKHYLKVFLCHASQDKPKVRGLYQRLKAEGWIDPWLDEEKLTLGQHWNIVIENALDEADVVIIFLSSDSVQKEGFVQRELNYAWELSLEKPRSVIFLIPFRLDDCEVPRHLRSRHWGDYFDTKRDETYQALLQSLKFRAEQLGRATTQTLQQEVRDGLSKKNVKIQLVEYNQPKRHSDQQASIYVINNDEEDLTECTGRIVSMTYHWPDGSPSTDYGEVVTLARPLAWSAKTRLDDNHLIPIKPGVNQKAILDVARANSGDMIFTFANGDDSNNRAIGLYDFTVEIAGKIHGHPFQPVEGRFRLDFRGEDALFITKIDDGKNKGNELSVSNPSPNNISKARKLESKPITKLSSQKTQSKLKTKYIIAIIGTAVTIIGVLSIVTLSIAALSGIFPQLFKPISAPTATITLIAVPTATLHPSLTPTKYITTTPTLIPTTTITATPSYTPTKFGLLTIYNDLTQLECIYLDRNLLGMIKFHQSISRYVPFGIHPFNYSIHQDGCPQSDPGGWKEINVNTNPYRVDVR